MEIKNVAGLPAHPLFVHLPIIMIPMAAAGALILAVFPRLIARWGWWVVGFSGVGALGAVLAAGSGEALEESVRESEAIERHAELGEMARNVSLVLFAVVLVLMLARTFLSANRVRTVMASVVVAAASIGGVVTVVDAGHTGAESVWEDQVSEDGQQKDADAVNNQVEDEDGDQD